MKVIQLLEYGRIVLGVNTTQDVSPNEIPNKQESGDPKVDKDGRPSLYQKKKKQKKVKGKSTNVPI